jgi:hypothetical protein
MLCMGLDHQEMTLSKRSQKMFVTQWNLSTPRT